MNSIPDMIYSLISAKLGGEILSPDEEAQLSQWLEDDSNRDEFDAYRTFFEARETYSQSHNVEIPAGWPEKIFDRPVKKRLALKRWMKYAAVLIPLIAVSLITVTLLTREDGSTSLSEVMPGTYRAVLVTESGEQHMLSEAGAVFEDGIIKGEEEGIVKYKATEDRDAKPEYHTLWINRGSEYKLELPDGTLVWLNSDSHIRYPSTFIDGERRVFISGEGYFKVKRDETKPFIVETEDQILKVLGTEFNIYAYANEENVQTTLVNGSVEVAVKNGSDMKILAPGEQSNLDLQTGRMSVHQIDSNEIIAWKEGFFVFEGQSLEQVLMKLSRWYDVEFDYSREKVQGIRFKGSLPRYENLQTILELIQITTPVEFDKKGAKINVKVN